MIWWLLGGISGVLLWMTAGRRISMLLDGLVTLPYGPADELPAVREALAGRAAGDEVSYVVKRSVLSWPTPWAMNFMTGRAPSWRRHLYYRLVWKKRSGVRVEMVWRYEQWYYGGHGWSSGTMSNGDATGLIWKRDQPLGKTDETLKARAPRAAGKDEKGGGP